MAQLDIKHKTHSHHIDEIPNYLLEANRPEFSLENRLLVAAQRLLDEPQGGMNGNGSLYPLRYHQLPAFTNFSTYLMDFVTRPDNTSVSPYCRIVLPPRTGKTVVAGNMIARTGLNSTFVVPTKTLIRQVSNELRSQMPEVPVGVHYSELRNAVNNGVNITTYASLQRHSSRGILPDAIRNSPLIFLDEAHHAMTKLRMKALRQAFDRKAIRIALTATPDYNEKRSLQRFFPDLIHELDLAEAFAMELLAPTRMWVVEVDANASTVRFVAGDFEQEMLGRLMSSSPFFKAVQVFRYQNSNVRIPALISCTSRQQAYDLWKYLIKHRPKGRPKPGLILGETTKDERERLLSGYTRNRIDTLIQVGVLIEGWNAPHCKLLIDLAPSLSRVRATQKYFRVMTRYADQEARIFVILPKNLPSQPILPLDLLLKPGVVYSCGDLLRPTNEQGTRSSQCLDLQVKTPIKSVKIKKRILACAPLQKPALDPTDFSQIREVLRSCSEFDFSSLCTRRRLHGMFFQHPLFAGSGKSLLHYLGVPYTKGAYWAFMAKLFTEQVQRRIIDKNGGPRDELLSSCLDDFKYFEQAMLKPNGNNSKPEKPFPSTLRMLCGGVKETPTPEDLVIMKELTAQLIKFVLELNEREKCLIIQYFGLFGEPGSTYTRIGEQFGVCGQRVRQIIAKALRRIRLKYRKAGINVGHTNIKYCFEYPDLLEILRS